MSATTSPYNATEIESDCDGVVSSGSNSWSGPSETAETETVFLWRTLLFILFWCLAVLIIARMAFVCCRQQQRQLGASAQEKGDGNAQGDVEQPRPSPPKVHQCSSRQLKLPSLTALIAMGFSIVPHVSCKYLLVESQDYRVEGIGIWSAYGDEQCFSTVNNEYFGVDTPIRSARIMAAIATAFGCWALLRMFYFISTSDDISRLRIAEATMVLCLAFVFQMATLALLKTYTCDDPSTICELDGGGVASITASIYWLIAAGGTVSSHCC